MRPAAADPVALGPGSKVVVGLGDHTISLALSALSFFYLFFLTEEVGLRPSLAGAVLFAGRAVDAFSDPLMGRVSDLTRTRAGRRRPYLLAGALPFGVSFAALWTDPGLESQTALFGYYALTYMIFSLCSTVVAVPYTALIPELVSDYQERTSINTYRAALTVCGTLLAALAMQPLVAFYGGGSGGYLRAAAVLAVWIVLPWIGVFAVTRERSDFQRPPRESFAAGVGTLARHRNYRFLSGLYICGRISMDIAGAMFLFYLTYWFGRPDDFGLIMATVMVAAVVALPIWLRISRESEKKTLFIVGCVLWLAVQPILLMAQPEWPIGIVLGCGVFMGIGFAVVDMMPWSMLGEVIDEDELVTGERREGVYAGFFTFIRKLAGAAGVWIAGTALELAGFRAGGEQGEAALWAVRGVTALGPAVFLVLAIVLALPYRLGRGEHSEILTELARRRGPEAASALPR